jgi:hypothetical protein
MRGLSKNIHAYVAWQDIKIGLTAEDVSWSPDVAHDMANRLADLWHSTLLELYRFGMLAGTPPEGDEDDDDAEPFTGRELFDQRIVRLEEGNEDG